MATEMRKYTLITLLFTLFMSSSYANQANTGWVENVNIGNQNMPMIAKIDSGADNSSINAINPELYKKNGKPWVRFALNNGSGQQATIDEPVLKTTRIKTKDKRLQERLVIELDVCLNNVRKRVPVNLVDRSNFKYPVLIGRSFLKSDFLIDSGKTFITQSCTSYL